MILLGIDVADSGETAGMRGEVLAPPFSRIFYTFCAFLASSDIHTPGPIHLAKTSEVFDSPSEESRTTKPLETQ